MGHMFAHLVVGTIACHIKENEKKIWEEIKNMAFFKFFKEAVDRVSSKLERRNKWFYIPYSRDILLPEITGLGPGPG